MGRRLLFAAVALLAALALLAACGGDGNSGASSGTDEPATPAALPSPSDEAIKEAATDYLLRSGVLAPGTGGVVLLADGQCATGDIWLQSEADALGAALFEIAGSDDAGTVDESGTLLVEVGSTGGHASQSDCLKALDKALSGFNATQAE